MIDLKAVRTMPDPWQNVNEWMAFLQFCKSHFKSRGIGRPLVVELGVYENRQRPYYERFLNAEHVGVDISDQYTKPDILGDTHSPQVHDALVKRIGGRSVDLLYIDADHNYDDVRQDYEMYGHLVTKGLVAFHDIRSYGGSVGKLWGEISEASRNKPDWVFIEIGCWTSPTYQMGTGVIVRL